MFGGTANLTQELNDLYIYDINNQNWIQVFENVSPINAKSILNDHEKTKESSRRCKEKTLSNLDKNNQILKI